VLLIISLHGFLSWIVHVTLLKGSIMEQIITQVLAPRKHKPVYLQQDTSRYSPIQCVQEQLKIFFFIINVGVCFSINFINYKIKII